jgi:predicted nucleic acid-binding protein
LEGGLADVRDEIRARMVGHHQLTDAVLLDLAIRNQGRLATFDRRILGLLPPNLALGDAVALIPA